MTLTFQDRQSPTDFFLQKRPLQLFLKRLRELTAPRLIRYYAVGEYGDQNWRAHYHLLLFGVSPTEEALIKKCWPFGFIKVGTCEPASMSYVAGYVIKKMTSPKDRRLNGRPPEFALMSKRPGIGFGAVGRIVKAYQSSRGKIALSQNNWISTAMRSCGSIFPLGRYLTDHVTSQLGLTLAQKTEYKEALYAAIAEQFRGEDKEERGKRYVRTWQREEGKRKVFKHRTL